MDISVKTIEVDRRAGEGLICQDNIRADIKVTFFVRVNKTADDVLKVAQNVGVTRASDHAAVEELFAAKFSEALKTVGKRLDFEDLCEEREKFRDDTYNLGDILEGTEGQFELSCVENALTSNAVLSPIASRSLDDVYRSVRMARGEEVPSTELEQGYSAVEVQEAVSVLEKLLRVQKVLGMVNAEYIRSASMEDAYRTEPPFKLQGSYRNMNKLAEKVVAAMNDEELERLIDDHYQGESQTLTTGAEQNLLKLAEMRGRMSAAQEKR